MSEITFETVEVPKTVKTGANKLPNPFEGKFPSDDAALKLTLPYVTDDDVTAVNRLVRQAQEAARKVDRSARVLQEDSKEGVGRNRHPVKLLTVWTVPKITRKSKEETPDDSAPSDDSTDSE